LGAQTDSIQRSLAESAGKLTPWSTAVRDAALQVQRPTDWHS
jgi:hypothetical protein